MNILKLVVFFVLLQVPGWVHAQDEVKPKYAPRSDKRRNVTDEFGQKQGTWVFYGRTFGLQFEIDYVNNRREGAFKSYYPGGKIKLECAYKNNKRDGEYKTYYFSGQVKIEGNFDYGKKDGAWTKYFDDGSVRQEFGYKKNVPDGTWKYYNAKGDLKGTIVYINGVDERILIEAQKRKDAEKAAAEKKTPAKAPSKK